MRNFINVRQDILDEEDNHDEKFCYDHLLENVVFINDIQTKVKPGMLEKFCEEQNVEDAFDERNFVNIHAIDKFVRCHGLQLKYLEISQESTKKELNEVWNKIDEQSHAQLILHYKNHYIQVLKIIHMYYMFVPEYENGIRHTREELIQFLREKNCYGFLCEELGDGLPLKHTFSQNLYGGGKRKISSDEEWTDKPKKKRRKKRKSKNSKKKNGTNKSRKSKKTKQKRKNIKKKSQEDILVAGPRRAKVQAVKKVASLTQEENISTQRDKNSLYYQKNAKSLKTRERQRYATNSQPKKRKERENYAANPELKKT